MSRLKLTLEENAISFAEDALANAIVAEETPKRWKFAILSLIQAIELSLKELLRRQHSYLIYKNIDNPDKTVGIDQAAHRLRMIAGVTLTADESSALRTAVDVRNKIVHHYVDEAVADLKLVFARLLGFLNDFHGKHLEEPLQDAIDDELWQRGVRIKEYGEELYRRAKKRLAADDLMDDAVITCPKCGWDALTAWGTTRIGATFVATSNISWSATATKRLSSSETTRSMTTRITVGTAWFTSPTTTGMSKHMASNGPNQTSEVVRQ